MERKVENGLRATLAATLLLMGCRAVQQEISPIATPEPTPLTSGQTKEYIGQKEAVIYGDISEEYKDIVSSIVRRIPGAYYLADADIKVNKVDPRDPVSALATGHFKGDITPSLTITIVDSKGQKQTIDSSETPSIYVYLPSNFNPSAGVRNFQEIQEIEFFRNQQEALAWYLTAESGHSFIIRVSRIANESGVGPEWIADMSLDENEENFTHWHPIYSTFMQVFGWDKDPQSVIRREFVQKAIGKPYSVYSVFPDAFAASILRPNLLTDEEQRYFEIIFNGLNQDPEGFIRTIIADPQSLLQ